MNGCAQQVGVVCCTSGATLTLFLSLMRNLFPNGYPIPLHVVTTLYILGIIHNNLLACWVVRYHLEGHWLMITTRTMVFWGLA